jgi:uncharacterized delta-60 repeat protein
MRFAWLSSLRTRFRRSTSGLQPGRGAPRRLALEALEERTLLSAGDLDPTFGNGGLVTTGGGSTGLGASHLAVQADGRIVAGGLAASKAGFYVELLRYNSDGSADTSFGSRGLVLLDFPGGHTLGVSGGMALQSDGRIVVSGGAAGKFALARYNSNGTLDSSFGTGGTVSTSFPGGGSNSTGVAVQADGSIVAAGTFSSGSGSASFALARYTPDGSLDTSFGNNGQVVTAFPGQPSAQATGLTLQEDGSIVVAGYTYGNSQTPQRFALARYDHDGHLDPSFGMGGLVTTPFPGFSNAYVSDVVVQSDGRIVLAGYVSHGAGSGTEQLAMARYDSDGSLDGSFGTGGLVTTLFPGATRAWAGGMTLQADGRIVVAGWAGDFAVARFDSDGSLDGSFGTAGLVTTSFGDRWYAQAGAVTVQPDGRIVAAGSGSASGWAQLTMARYLGDTSTATHFTISAPAEVTAGQPFEVTVTARDENGNVVPDYTGTVSLSSTDPGAAFPGSHTFTTDDAGVYTFSGVQLFTAGPQSLFASDGSLGGQADLTVDPGLAVALLLTGPDHATAGVAFVVTLRAYDAYGNVATGYRGSVSFVSTDPQSQLPVDYGFTSDDAGSHDFTITLNSPGPVRLTAIDTYALTLSYLDLTVS